MATENQINKQSDRDKDNSLIDQQQTSSKDYDQLMREAEEDAPRTGKPGSTGGDSSDQDNNGRGGGK